MRSWNDLIHSTIFAPTREWRDKDGNLIGSSTDITPAMELAGRIIGTLWWVGLITLPLTAPIYYLLAIWFCNHYNERILREDPEWPKERARILKIFRNIFIAWVIFMTIGALTNWGQVPHHNLY